MTNTPNQQMDHLSKILPQLICPECREDLGFLEKGLTCQGCSKTYEIADGIPLLGQVASTKDRAAETSVDYQTKFQASNIGERYQQRYRDSWHKEFATKREIKCLTELLSSQSRCGRLLDMPCGGGRVSGPMANSTDFLIQADIGLSQVKTARELMGSGIDAVWLTASVFAIPLKDNSVDATVCNRLAHHLPSGPEQEQLIKELLRVSSRFVILSYYDEHSVKSMSRRLRGKKPGHTMARKTLRQLAERYNASVAKDIPLLCPGSRLRYALLKKKG